MVIKKIFVFYIMIVMIVGCSNLKYINKNDTTESEWKKIPHKQSTQEKTNKPAKIVIQKDSTKHTHPSPAKQKAYKTPRAGTPLKADISSGQIKILPIHIPFVPEQVDVLNIDEMEITVPARNRRNISALTLGASIVSPNIGGITLSPFGAFFLKRQSDDNQRRLRGILTGVYNFIDYADGTWNDNGWEALVHWENFTVPIDRSEIIEGEEAEFTEIEWGYVKAGFGIGWRTSISPGYSDNDLRLQLFYEPGYLYSKSGDDTGDDVILPPDTFTHGLHFLARADALVRNFVELPHEGWAFGGDVVLAKRDRWRDHQFSDILQFDKDDTKEYLRLSGYILLATGIPSFPERHRLIFTAHGGWSPSQNWDRFSAFRIGGGAPPVSESNDLLRAAFPGALPEQLIAEDYLIISAEYRYEVDFFMFLHTRGTFIVGEFGFLEDGELDTSDNGWAFSVGLTSGFLWDSLIYLEYTLNDNFVRQQDSGYGFLISWSKSFGGQTAKSGPAK